MNIYRYLIISKVGGQAPHLYYCNDVKFDKDYTVRYVLNIVAPVGSDSRCLTRDILIWFGANINI